MMKPTEVQIHELCERFRRSCEGLVPIGDSKHLEGEAIILINCGYELDELRFQIGPYRPNYQDVHVIPASMLECKSAR